MISLSRKGWFCLFLCLSLSSFSQIPSRPQPPRLVNDFVGLLQASELFALERDLVAFDDSSSNQICVVIVPDLQGMEIQDLAFKIGEQWQVGQSGLDNGIVLLIKTKSDTRGEVAISTGYGLEAVLTDAACRRIIEEDILPFFREDRYYEGIQAGLDRIKALAAGEFSYASSARDYLSALGFFLVFIIFIVIFFILLNHKNKGRGPGNGNNKGKGLMSDLTKAILLSDMAAGGRNRGGSSGGYRGGMGGFGGFGGGRFGGGGAKGGW